MILSSCFSWIPVLCEKLVDVFIPRPQSEYLPENIVAEILSRLPAKNVYQCRIVCKQWSSLISTPSFNAMYLKRATPTVIFHRSSRLKKALRFIDEWGDMNSKRRKPRTKQICASEILSANLKETTFLSFSYNGLLVFRTPPNVPNYTTIILNPITRDKVVIRNYQRGEICGLFFHPIAREYHVLWQALVEKRELEFKMLSLGPKIYWKRLSKFNASPRVNIPPVNLYEALHWMSGGHYYADNKKFNRPTCSQPIIIFSTGTEEFRVMPHPGDISKCSNKWETHRKLHLLDLEGQLSVCRCSDIIEIWVLEDYAGWFWTKRHNIKLESDFLDIGFVKPLGIQNGALILHMDSKGELLAYHLQEKSTKKFIFEKLNDPLTYTTACLHTDSLVSLKGSPVKIFMPWGNFSLYTRF